jgi:hypothetical protein
MSRKTFKFLGGGRAARPAALLVAAVLAVAVTGCEPTPPRGGPSPGQSNTTTATPGTPTTTPSPPSTQASGKPGHVFVINLENHDYNDV